jgi:two-component system NtrC family sensor kinase
MTLTPLPPMSWLGRANRQAIVVALFENAVHEVNNGLQVISGHAELLESVAGADEAVQRRARSIGAGARSASAMLFDLLTFASDGAEPAQRVTLPQIAERVMRLRRDSLKHLRIDSAVEPPESGGGTAVGSQRIVLQIVLNLVLNAEQALTGWPSATLRLRTRREGPAEELIVEDNGPGLPGDALLWAPDAVSGSNHLRIGMLVAQWLAEHQGGGLRWTTSEAGRGCRATLSLPAGP